MKTQSVLKNKWVKLTAQIILYSVIIWFWYLYISENLEQVRDIKFDLDTKFTIISLLSFTLGYLLLIVLWRLMLQHFAGIHIPLRKAYVATTLSWLGRYIPGKVWTLVGKTVLSTKDKEEVKVAGIVVVVEAIIFVLMGLLLCLPVAHQYLQINTTLILVALLSLIVILLQRKYFTKLAKTILQKLKIDRLKFPELSHLSKIMIGYMMSYLLWGIGFLFIVIAVNQSSNIDYIQIISLFICSWVAGLLVLISPAGIGVRESVLALGLSQLGILPAQVIALTVLARLIPTIIESVLILIGFVLKIQNKSTT